MKFSLAMLFVLLCLFTSEPAHTGETSTLVDALGNPVSFSRPVDYVICSGAGSLRLLTYLNAQHLVVAVDDIETKRRRFDARPYALANPQFKTLSTFGEFRGFDNPERILSLPTQPQVIFKTYATTGHDPAELQRKTGITTLILHYGNLGVQRDQLDESLRIMGQVAGRQDRAEAVIRFFDKTIADLQRRTQGIAETDKKSCFLGGVAYRGPHGFLSTELGYPPFAFVRANNVAGPTAEPGETTRQVTISKEKLVAWNPDVLFMDLSTLQLGGSASGLWEIRNDPALKTLSAVREGRVYGVLPYNWYTKNFGSSLANAYFIGKILYPAHFEDVDPPARADEIYRFLVGNPVFKEMNVRFRNLVFQPVME